MCIFVSMKRLILAFFLSLYVLACAQEPMLTMEGWWTMSDGQHYFEDREIVPVKFVGEDLWGMDEYYSELVPEMGLPVQSIITARMNGDILEIYTLEIAPEGCEEY